MVPGATVTVRNVETNARRVAVTDSRGTVASPQPPRRKLRGDARARGLRDRRPLRAHPRPQPGRGGRLSPEGGERQRRRSPSTADAPLLNTTNAEVGVRFDTKRIAELPSGGRASSATSSASPCPPPGVSADQQRPGQLRPGADFAANGMRARSNNFMIDGQDSNDPSVTGRQQPINNTDIVQEIRLITNQFAAEYGRAAGSVMNVVTKSGTNAFHGSGFWFTNRDKWNSLSNLDKAAGLRKPPPGRRTSTASRWAARSSRTRPSSSAPISAGQTRPRARASPSTARPPRRAVPCSSSGRRPPPDRGPPEVPARGPDAHRAERDLHPGRPDLHRPPGRRSRAPRPRFYNDDQFSGRIDQKFGARPQPGRALPLNDDASGGTGQVTPAGLTTVGATKRTPPPSG